MPGLFSPPSFFAKALLDAQFGMASRSLHSFLSLALLCGKVARKETRLTPGTPLPLKLTRLGSREESWRDLWFPAPLYTTFGMTSQSSYMLRVDAADLGCLGYTCNGEQVRAHT
jgi:hypothetical protein